MSSLIHSVHYPVVSESYNYIKRTDNLEAEKSITICVLILALTLFYFNFFGAVLPPGLRLRVLFANVWKAGSTWTLPISGPDYL